MITITVNQNSGLANFISQAAENLGGSSQELARNLLKQPSTHIIEGETITAGVDQSIFSITLPDEFSGDALRFWGEVQKIKKENETASNKENPKF